MICYHFFGGLCIEFCGDSVLNKKFIDVESMTEDQIQLFVNTLIDETIYLLYTHGKVEVTRSDIDVIQFKMNGVIVKHHSYKEI